MNIYKSLNEITDYIDNHLDEVIEYKKLAKIIGVNEYTMHRIFSLLTNISLAEYIRKRRLSNAGFDIHNKNVKVMDLAMKYQYNNSTSFSRAFTAFHGIKPSHVTEKTKLKNFPKIIFDENINVVKDIEYNIVEYPKMILYGLGVTTNNQDINKDAPRFFKEVLQKYDHILGKIQYGMVTYQDSLRDECDEYWVLYEKNAPGLKEYVIEASKWLVFRINSQNAKDIQEASQNFYFSFLPSCKYNLKEIPELEYYHDDVTDFLVPIY